MMNCADCGAEVHPLEVFPKRRCLNCHAAEFDKDPQGQYEQMMRGFSGGVINTEKKRKKK